MPMEFMLVTTGMLLLLVGVLVLLAKAYPGSGADLVDWTPTRTHEQEAILEMEDLQQMIDAQNEYRRRHGKAAITEDDAERWAREDNTVRERGRLGGENMSVLDDDPE